MFLCTKNKDNYIEIYEIRKKENEIIKFRKEIMNKGDGKFSFYDFYADEENLKKLLQAKAIYINQEECNFDLNDYEYVVIDNLKIAKSKDDDYDSYQEYLNSYINNGIDYWAFNLSENISKKIGANSYIRLKEIMSKKTGEVLGGFVIDNPMYTNRVINKKYPYRLNGILYLPQILMNLYYLENGDYSKIDYNNLNYNILQLFDFKFVTSFNINRIQDLKHFGLLNNAVNSGINNGYSKKLINHFKNNQ